MTDILLSIKPKYAKLIYDGTKRYEFRRVMPKNLLVGDTVYLYETLPKKLVTGCFVLGEGGIVTTDRDLLWKITHEYAGISKREFMLYFGCANRVCYASAMKIASPNKYLLPYVLSALKYHFYCFDDVNGNPITKPPQSFRYVYQK